MTHEEFLALREQIALRVWEIECAEMMICVEDARKRWAAMPTEGSNRRLELRYVVGFALMALQERRLLVEK